MAMALLNGMDVTYRQWLLEALARDAERWAKVEEDLARIRRKAAMTAEQRETTRLAKAA
jgi:hypothetical protein